MTASRAATLLALALAAGCVTQTTSGSADAGVATERPDVVAGDSATPTDTSKPLPDLPVVEECEADADCDDGLFCNGAETCNPAALGAGPDGCLAGEAPVAEDDNLRDCQVPSACNEDTDGFDVRTLSAGETCDDGIACTDADTCTDEGTCAGEPTDTRCNDGQFCNGVERCTAELGCVPGLAPSPTDGDPGDCLVPGPCDELTDSHPLVPAAIGKSCDDGIPCTVADGCTSAGTCAGEPNHGACSDDVFCNGPEVCTVGVGCGPGVAVPPEDPDPADCLVPATCDETTDSWAAAPVDAGTPCDDGVTCTTNDVCDASGGCGGAPDDAACDDGAFCNGAEACDPENAAGSDGCVAGVAPEPPQDLTLTDCTAPGPCDEAADGFPEVPLPEATDCDDGADCTAGDACDADGACIGTPDDGLCDDGVWCNGAETCTGGLCAPGTPPAAPIPGPCEQPPVCDDATQTFIIALAMDGTPCNDMDICIGGVCQPPP